MLAGSQSGGEAAETHPANAHPPKARPTFSFQGKAFPAPAAWDFIRKRSMRFPEMDMEIDYTMFRGLLSGLISGFTGRNVLLKKVEKDLAMWDISQKWDKFKFVSFQ